MVTEKDKYRAQFYQISGFALMSPLGKLIIDLKTLKIEDFHFILFIYTFIYAVLFLCGMLLICKGLDFLEEKRKYYE